MTLRSVSSNTRRKRAVTLIEAVLYISVALALIVGGLVFYQQANAAARTSALVRQPSAVLAEARVLIKGQPLNTVIDPLAAGTDLTPLLIAAGAVPADTVTSPTTLTTPFGGQLAISGSNGPNGQFSLFSLTEIPRSVCARIISGGQSNNNASVATVLSGKPSQTAIGNGQIAYAVFAPTTMIAIVPLGSDRQTGRSQLQLWFRKPFHGRDRWNTGYRQVHRDGGYVDILSG